MKKLILIILTSILITGCHHATNQEDLEVIENEMTTVEPVNTRSGIERYLESQNDFAWKTEENGKNFCTFFPFNGIEETTIYIWARCSELELEGDILKEHSGISVPVKLEYPIELSSMDYTKFTHEIPRNGSLYAEDIEKLFPKDIRTVMESEKNIIFPNLDSELIQKAKEYFEVNKFTEIPSSLKQKCEKDIDCKTPFSFLIQSNCPYESICIENICEVVCPIMYYEENKNYYAQCEENENCNCSERGEKSINCICSKGNCFSIEQ